MKKTVPHSPTGNKLKKFITIVNEWSYSNFAHIRLHLQYKLKNGSN